jgi:TonB dependent receptor-like, beta-barrel/Carboxypeptidase regulatory-like domain
MRWRTLWSACIAVVIINAMSVWAQSEAVIRGQLVADADGFGLPRGSVTLKSVTTGSATETNVDPMGYFTFSNISPGEYLVTGAADGFSNREVRVFVEPRDVRTVTLRLAVRGVSENVNVTGDLARLPSTHSPSSTSLSADWIESVPVSQRTGLPDAIVTAAPGMIRGHDDFVHVRGEEVALNPLINGVAFWENPHSVFSSGLSPDVIETANVMTGGFPAEYGNRFGGVVDIVTKSGLRMANSGSVTVNGGEAGRFNLLGDFGGHSHRIGYYGFGSMFESDRFLSPPDPEAIHDHGHGGHGLFQLDGDLGDKGQLRAMVMVDGSNFEIPVTPQDVQLRPQALASERTRQQTAVVGWNRAWSDMTASATFYQRWSRSDLLPATGPLTAEAAVRRDVLTLGGKVDVTRFMRRHVVKFGVDGVRLRPDEQLTYDSTGFEEYADLIGVPTVHFTDNPITFASHVSGGQISGYVQDDIRLSDRITADVGVRVDHYSLVLSETHASPRLNIAVQTGRGTIVHASYNNFFVAPPVEGVLSSAAGLTAFIQEIGVPMPPVQPTTEHQFEVGAIAPAGALQVGATGYYRTSENPVHTTIWPDSRIYSYASFTHARAYGLETRVDLPRLLRYGLTGYFNYALGRVYFYNPVTGGFVTEPEHLDSSERFLAPMDQTHTLTGGLTYRHRATGFWAGTAVEYGSGTPTEREDTTDARVPGHFTANISFGFDLLRSGTRKPRLSLQMDIENVTNNLYLVAQESEFAAGQYSIPRLVAVTVKARF